MFRVENRFGCSFLLTVLGIAVGLLLPGSARAQTYICFGSTSTDLTPSVAAECSDRAGGQILSFSMGVSSSFLPITGTKGNATASGFTFQIPNSIAEFFFYEDMLAGRQTPLVAVGFNSTKPGPNGTVVPYNITLVLKNVYIQSVQAGGGNTGLTDSVTLTYGTIEVIDNSTSPATIFTWTNPA